MKTPENSACHNAKVDCLEKHSAKHPSDVFHCEIESKTLEYSADWMSSLSDGTFCLYSNKGMDAAQYSCIVEVVPGAE